MTRVSGTFAYASPQMLKKEKYSKSTDFFSFGVLTFELIHKKHPYNFTFIDDRQRPQVQEMKAYLSAYNAVNWSGSSGAAHNFLKALIASDEDRRLGIMTGSIEISQYFYMKGVSFNDIKRQTLKPPFSSLDAKNWSFESSKPLCWDGLIRQNRKMPHLKGNLQMF